MIPENPEDDFIWKGFFSSHNRFVSWLRKKYMRYCLIQDRIEGRDLEEHYAPNPRNASRPLTDGDVDSFLDAADDREDPMWEAIDAYTRPGGPLWQRSPARTKMLRQELRWMRRAAAIDGVHWGKR